MLALLGLPSALPGEQSVISDGGIGLEPISVKQGASGASEPRKAGPTRAELRAVGVIKAARDEVVQLMGASHGQASPFLLQQLESAAHLAMARGCRAVHESLRGMCGAGAEPRGAERISTDSADCAWSAAGIGQACYRLAGCYCGGVSGLSGTGAGLDAGLAWLLVGAAAGDAPSASAAAAILDAHADGTRAMPAAARFRSLLAGADRVTGAAVQLHVEAVSLASSPVRGQQGATILGLGFHSSRAATTLGGWAHHAHEEAADARNLVATAECTLVRADAAAGRSAYAVGRWIDAKCVEERATAGVRAGLELVKWHAGVAQAEPRAGSSAISVSASDLESLAPSELARAVGDRLARPWS